MRTTSLFRCKKMLIKKVQTQDMVTEVIPLEMWKYILGREIGQEKQ